LELKPNNNPHNRPRIIEQESDTEGLF